MHPTFGCVRQRPSWFTYAMSFEVGDSPKNEKVLSPFDREETETQRSQWLAHSRMAC